MDIIDIISLLGYSITIFSFGIRVGIYLSDNGHKNNRPTPK